MSDLYTVTDLSASVDQIDHPGMNYGEFSAFTDQELKKFIGHVAAMNAEYISPQDVGGVGGLSCRFHSINGYPAVRQMTQYNPNRKTWSVWFDCRVLTRAAEVVKANGDMSAKLDPLFLPEPDAPVIEPPAETKKVTH